MLMNKTPKKPYVIYMAEIIYSYISIIKNRNSNIDTKEAINNFIKTEDFNRLSSGSLHDEWFDELKKNNYLDKDTGEKIPNETIIWPFMPWEAGQWLKRDYHKAQSDCK